LSFTEEAAMARGRSRFLILSIVGGLLLLTLAASAHEFEDPGPLTIRKNHKNPYDKHEVVVFKGRIKTDREFCQFARIVRLFKGPNRELDRDITGHRGRYKVTWTLNSVGIKHFHTEVLSKVGGAHPHRHVCLADSSRTVKVVVKQLPG
jgi:hypothetical protein